MVSFSTVEHSKEENLCSKFRFVGVITNGAMLVHAVAFQGTDVLNLGLMFLILRSEEGKK